MTVKLRMSTIPSGDRGVTGCLDQFDGIFAFSMLFSYLPVQELHLLHESVDVSDRRGQRPGEVLQQQNALYGESRDNS